MLTGMGRGCSAWMPYLLSASNLRNLCECTSSWVSGMVLGRGHLVAAEHPPRMRAGC